MPEKSFQTASTFIQHDHTSPKILSEHLPSSSTVIILDMAVDDVDQEASTGLGVDDESRAFRLKIGEIPTEYPLIQSRVLKDPCHIFNMIYISKACGLLYDFAHALHDAMFILDKEDKDIISVFPVSLDPPRAWATLLCYHPSFL